ncbi:MAG TPA: histidine kinase [Jiangellaceae bacterium]|nr:histidine kinase [Jiangellaceae bacterium]
MRLSVLALATAGAIASAAIAADLGALPATSAFDGAGAVAATLVAGLGLVSAGAAASIQESTRRMATPVALAGVVWLAPLWVAWPASPDFARSAGLLAAPFLVPLLGHLVLGRPGVHSSTAGGRRLLVTLYAGAVAVATARALFFDPFLDLGCWTDCPDNAFLLISDPQLTRIVRTVGLLFCLVGGVAVAVLAARQLWTNTAVGRRATGPVALPLSASAACEAAVAAAMLFASPAGLKHPPFLIVGLISEAVALSALAAGVGWILLREHRRWNVVVRMAEALGVQPASLQATLAGSLGDDHLQVAYRLPGSDVYVDTRGGEIAQQPRPGQTMTQITRGGEPVAMVVHDRALHDASRLNREIGSAARLAIDNERLRAALFWELENLRASRMRIVEAADEVRRGLERDLHDGAQQRLLAVTFELRLARDEAKASGDEPLAAALGALVDEAQSGLGELRELAHGIFPTILDQAGLDAALSRLADSAAVPVEFSGDLDHRLPADVERTAYLVASTAVDTATRHRAERLQLAVEHRDGSLIIDALGAGEDEQVHIADRVGALGGTLITTAKRWRAEIPCA